MADEIIIETTSQEVVEVGVPGPQGPAGAAGTGLETLTNKGDTLYRGETTGERLPIGSTGQILRVSSSGVPEWGAADFAAASHTHAASAITSGVLDNARVNFAAPPAIGAQTPNTGAFTNLSAASRLNLPSASGSIANDIWVSGGQLRYQSGIQVTSARTLLTAEDNLSNLANAATARTNIALGSADSVTFGSIQNTPIGSTTASSGAFTTLSANNGTLTASAPVLDLEQTWNNAAVTFTGLRINVTNTASAAASLLADFQVGGTSQFSVSRAGTVTMQGNLITSATTVIQVGSSPRITLDGTDGTFLALHANHEIRWATGRSDQAAANPSLILVRDGASDVLAQRRSTNPQTFRLYNTFTDASNHERGFMRWSSNVLQIGTEKAGTGSARNLQFLTDNTARITIDTSGNVGVNVSAPERPFHISGSSMWARFDRVGSVGPAIMMVRQATLGSTNSSWLLGSPNTAGVSNEDFAVIDYGVNISGTVGTPRLTIAKSDGQLTVNGNLNLSTKDLVTDTTTGTKIGTGTTQKLGFFNATPIVRPAAIADATDAATTQARLNDLLAAMRSLGLIAT